MSEFYRYFDFFYALGFYFFFFVLIVVLRGLSGATPNGTFSKQHFYSVIGYLAFRVGLERLYFENPRLPVIDVLLGLLVYFMVHYAVMVNFIGLASRSVSSTVLVDLAKQKGPSTWDKIYSSYGGGKGFEFIKANRLENMVKYGLVTKSEDHYMGTRFGIVFFKAAQKILGLWNLKPINNDLSSP